VIAPHPDDEVAGCAGTLFAHREAGDPVDAVFVTDGSRSRALGFDRAAMAEQREIEARAAASRIGAQCHWLGFPEGDWAERDGQSAIERKLVDLKPTVLYAPSSIDFHPEHRRVARVLATALEASCSKPEVRIYAIQVPLTPLLTNMIADVSSLETSIRLAFRCYPSQRTSLESCFRARRYAAAFYGVNELAEGFCAMPAELYVSLHRRPPAQFRPMAIRPWTDPLALAVGTRERLHWKARARSVSAFAPPAARYERRASRRSLA
jgi:LmbE family N-acetylglucosaminyl deacetylase